MAKVRVCCGPRCGAEPGQRTIYTAVEKAAMAAGIDTAPVMCRGACGGGVTVVLPNENIWKVRDVREAKALPLTEAPTEIGHANH